MKCFICGQIKPDYHFFKHRNKYDRAFFMNTIPVEDLCWDCGGPYKCAGCGKIKPASAFRVGGRFCNVCKTNGIHRSLADEINQDNDIASGDSLDGVETLESGVFE